MKRIVLIALLSITVIGSFPLSAQGGIWDKVATGLDWAGFSVTGERNPLSGGAEMNVYRYFNNTDFDLGFASLQLTGPVSFSFKTGDRFMDTLAVSLNTGNQAMTYDLMIDMGGQKTTYTGSMLLDASANVNEFGFYDLTFDYSMRQTILEEGRFADYEELADTDIGPINISGNLFADMLSVVFDPLCDAFDVMNPFQSFSGKYSAGTQLDTLIAEAEEKLYNGGLLSSKEISELLAYSMTYESLGGEAPDLDFLEEVDVLDDSGLPLAATPEPAALVLLGLGTIVMFRRRR